MKPVTIHKDAIQELTKAVEYYDRSKPGLGDAFQLEIESATRKISMNPSAFASYGVRQFRKCFVKRFPFTIYFREAEDRIWIAAIAHQKRQPGYWFQRQPE